MLSTRTTRAQDTRAGRPLRLDERALLERLCAVVPSAVDVLVDVDGVRVRETDSRVDRRATRSVVRVGRRDMRGTTALPVRGFPVNDGGRTVGEVVVWVAAGQFVGYRWCAVPGDPVPDRWDPEMLDAVPWV